MKDTAMNYAVDGLADLLGMTTVRRHATCELLREAADEIIRLRQWVDDLQSGMYVNCVYCGHRYGPGDTTPVSMADALKEHVEQCPKHPMSRLRSHADSLEQALEPLMKRCRASLRKNREAMFHPEERQLQGEVHKGESALKAYRQYREQPK